MAEEVKGNHRKKKIAFSIFALVLIVGLVVGLLYVRYKKTHISTDDAFVEGTVYTVSSRIDGTVEEVFVKDNQFVKKGELLVRLDRSPYEKKLNEALAALKAQRAMLDELGASLRAQKKKVEAARAELSRRLTEKEELVALVSARKAELKATEAELAQARLDLRRAEGLYKKGVIPREKYDRADTAYRTIEAKVEASKALLAQAKTRLKGFEKVIKQAEASVKAERALYEKLKAGLKAQKAKVKSAEAVVALTRLQLSYTEVYAPDDGYVTKKSVNRGEQIRAGQPLLAIVPGDGLYIVANYKETKIKSIKKGMKVRIKVDAYPDIELTGVVDSIMAGTGAAFSLFPPENATGNYVKVVQRIPVKIILTKGPDSSHPLRVGMSVVPTVLVQ